MHPSGKFFLLSVNGHGSGQGDADIAAFFPETGSYVLFADLVINLMDAENIPGLFGRTQTRLIMWFTIDG